MRTHHTVKEAKRRAKPVQLPPGLMPPLTLAQTAIFLHMGRTKLYGLIKKGKINIARRVAGAGSRSAFLFDLEEVKSLLQPVNKPPDTDKQEIPEPAQP